MMDTQHGGSARGGAGRNAGASGGSRTGIGAEGVGALSFVYGQPLRTKCKVEFWGREGIFMDRHRLFGVTYAPWRGPWSGDAVEQSVRSVLPRGTEVYGCLRAEHVRRRWMRVVRVLVDFGGVGVRTTLFLSPGLFTVCGSQAVISGIGGRLCERRERDRDALSAAVQEQGKVQSPRGLVAVFGSILVTADRRTRGECLREGTCGSRRGCGERLP